MNIAIDYYCKDRYYAIKDDKEVNKIAKGFTSQISIRNKESLKLI